MSCVCRRSACLALLAAGAGAGAALLWRRCDRPRAAGSRGVREREWPVLQRTQGGSGPTQRSSLALWLLLTSVPGALQGEVLALAELALDALESRAHPLGIDLATAELEREAERLRPSLLPSYNCAAHLAGWPWPVPGSTEVVAPYAGERIRGDSCLAWATGACGESGVERVTRFAAWSLSQGLLLDCRDAGAVARLRHELARRIPVVASPPALLVDSRVQAMEPRLVPYERLMHLAVRARGLASRASRGLGVYQGLEAQLLRGLSEELPAAPALPWLGLRDSELFVVPKLGALARREAFLTELQGAAGRASVALTVAGPHSRRGSG